MMDYQIIRYALVARLELDKQILQESSDVEEYEAVHEVASKIAATARLLSMIRNKQRVDDELNEYVNDNLISWEGDWELFIIKREIDPEYRTSSSSAIHDDNIKRFRELEAVFRLRYENPPKLSWT